MEKTMDKGGHSDRAAPVGSGELLSATAFARATGVSRERLRTWERRFGFPHPFRHDGGPRRYAAADAGRVVAVRRAVAAGVPLAAAIEASRAAAARVAAGSDVVAQVAGAAPVPVVLLAGPPPLEVAWSNAAARLGPGGMEDLDPEPPAAGPVHDAIAALFQPGAVAREIAHPPWRWPDGPATMRSVGFPLHGAPDARPLVALVAIGREEGDALREELAETRAQLARLRREAERHTRWLDALAQLATEFQRDPGPALVERGLDALIRSTNAVDAGLAGLRSGRLVLPGSRRGLVRGGSLTGAAHPDLVRALRDHEGVWLSAAARTAFGMPRGIEASFVPVMVGGEPLGALVTCFNEVEPHDADNRRLLATLSATFGFAMLRDRLTEELAQASAGDEADADALPEDPRAGG